MTQPRFLLFRDLPGPARQYVTQDRRAKTYSEKGTLETAARFYSRRAARLIRDRLHGRFGPPPWIVGTAPEWETTPRERHE